ncbi:had family hydrolase, partial [Lasius niger]
MTALNLRYWRSARSVKYPKLNVPEIPEEICNTSLAKHAIDGSPKAKKSKRRNEDKRMELFEKKGRRKGKATSGKVKPDT